MKTTMKINQDVTVKKAALSVFKYSLIFFFALFRAINQQAHKLPWLYVGITILIFVIIYSVCVGKARAERDKALQQQITLQEQVEKLSLIIDAQKINK